jgi:Ca2+-binding RTX toxin-like protein
MVSQTDQASSNPVPSEPSNGFQGLIDEIEALEALIESGSCDIEATRLQISILEDRLAEQLNAIEPSGYEDSAEEANQHSSVSKGQGQGQGDTLYGIDEYDLALDQDAYNALYGDAGNDILYGGTGADALIFDSIANGLDIIRDFDAREGDILDLSGIIQNYDSTQKAIDDFIFFKNVEGGSILAVDTSGSGDISNAFDLIALQGMQDLNAQDLLSNGALMVF